MNRREEGVLLGILEEDHAALLQAGRRWAFVCLTHRGENALLAEHPDWKPTPQDQLAQEAGSMMRQQHPRLYLALISRFFEVEFRQIAPIRPAEMRKAHTMLVELVEQLSK